MHNHFKNILLVIFLLAACAPGGAAASYIPLPSDIPGAPTEVAPEIVGGSLVAPADAEGLRQNLQEQFPDLGVAPENLTPFGITYQGVETDFVVVPPILMDEQAQTFQSERLFIKLGENWQELTKAVSDQTVPVDVGAGGVLRPITVWGQGEIGPSFRPVFWYAEVTPEDIQTMTEDQLANFEFDFWPPDEIGKLMTGYEPGKPLFITMKGVDTGGGTGKLLAKVAVESETLPAEVPEGFTIGSGGLLRNPETGENILVMNPEADWERVRQEIIGGLWEANVDWASYTGQGNDATKYTKVEFIKAALEGTVFSIGIPVRLDGKNIPDGSDIRRAQDRIVIMKMVNITLDSIQIQTLAPDAFKQYTGKGWLENGQEAYDCASWPNTASNVSLFTTDTDGEKLVISVGSFYRGGKVIVSRQYLIGDFDPALYEKYPSSFRPDGIGVEADNALSFTLGYAIDELNYFSLAYEEFIGPSGEEIKTISVKKTMGYPDENGYFFNPNLFAFSPN